MKRDLQTIKTDFANAFIDAISSKSVTACVKLVASYEDQIYLAGKDAKLDMSKEEYDIRVKTNTKEFLDKASNFIDEKNSTINSFLNTSNITEVDTYAFKISEEHIQIVDVLSITMNTRLLDGVNYGVGFQINDSFFINGKIKISNWFFAKYYESFWDDINEENTPYPKVQSKEKLKEICAKHLQAKHLAEDYSELLDDWNDWEGWYLHEGDLELDVYDLKVNFIVTGNLTIKEPLVEIEHELIVLGKTKLNALFLENDNNVCFLNGIDFNVGVFILYSDAGCRIFNKPKGPLLFVCSESHDIINHNEVQCFIDIEYNRESHGNINDLLLDKFIEKNENQVLDEHFDELIEAIRKRKNIFK